jgi:hypothetical protein
MKKRKNAITEECFLERCENVRALVMKRKTVTPPEIFGAYTTTNHFIMKALVALNIVHKSREGRGPKTLYVNKENLNVSASTILQMMRKLQSEGTRTLYWEKKMRVTTPVIDPKDAEIKALKVEIEKLKGIIKYMVKNL